MPVSRRLAFAVALILASQVQAAELARVESQSLSRLSAGGLNVIESYPGFALVSGDDGSIQRARNLGLTIEPESHGYRLQLPYGEAVDPQQRQPWHRSEGLPAPRELALVQFHGPTKPEWIAALGAADVEVLQYFHPYTYLVYNGSGGLDRVTAELNAVRWVGAWPQSARLADNLQTRSAETQSVRVLSYRGAEPSRSSLDTLGARVIDAASSDRVYADARVSIPGNRLAELAAQPGVISIQSVPSDGGLRGEISLQQFVGNVGQDNLPSLGYLGWLAPFAVSGDGIRIANVDGGVDHTHPNLVNRMLPCVGTTCSGTASGHGTHTAGIMVADGSDNIRNNNNFLRGLGVASGARLFEQVYSPFFTQPGGMLLLMKDSAANGAHVSGNSWGPAGSPRGYDADTRQVDVGVRDTDASLPGDQPLTYVLSIMNGNGGVSSQGTPDEAKNTITVGSTRSQSNANTPLIQWQDISANSGHGPALDGRTIPHLVAPGCSVDSTVIGGYGTMCGTSMASPHVTGAVALFAEALKKSTGALPSPALTRAAMVAATVDLNGRLDADGVLMGHRPDSRQGWGALRLGLLLEQFGNAQFFDQKTVFTATGDSWETTLRPLEARKSVEIVLSYTDAPGHGTCASGSCTTPAWNNDLNLSLVQGALTYKGNVFGSNGRSTTGGLADEKNNVEVLSFEPGQLSGDVTIRVSAANISADALPNLAGNLSQDFALYCNNCAPELPLFVDGFEGIGDGK